MKRSKRNNVSTVRQRERDKLLERAYRAIIATNQHDAIARQLGALSNQASQHRAMQNANAVANNPPRSMLGLGILGF